MYIEYDMIEKIKKGDFKTLREILLSAKYPPINGLTIRSPLLDSSFSSDFFITLRQAFEKTLVETLNLNNLQMKSFGVTLCQELRGTQIKILSLVFNDIAEYAPALAEALCNTQVHSLFLSRNNIEKYGPAMAQALCYTRLRILDLSYNKIGKYAPAMVQALCNTQVRTLNLNGNGLGEYAPAMAQALYNTKVNTLFLADNNLGEHTPAMTQALHNTQVNTLFLNGNNIGKYAPAMAQALCYTQVHTLDLSYNNNIAEHAPALAQGLQNTPVRTLLLASNNIAEHSPKFAQALHKTNVNNLNLCNNKIESQTALLFFQALQGTKIKQLSFSQASRGIKKTPFSKRKTPTPELFELQEPLIEALAKTSICVIDLLSPPDIKKVILENRQKVYTQWLNIAEYQGALLKELYQQAFPWNKLTFPSSIAHQIMKFLGYGNDKNLQKRFLNKLKIHSSSTPNLLAGTLSNPHKPMT